MVVVEVVVGRCDLAQCLSHYNWSPVFEKSTHVAVDVLIPTQCQSRSLPDISRCQEANLGFGVSRSDKLFVVSE